MSHRNDHDVVRVFNSNFSTSLPLFLHKDPSPLFLRLIVGSQTSEGRRGTGVLAESGRFDFRGPSKFGLDRNFSLFQRQGWYMYTVGKDPRTDPYPRWSPICRGVCRIGDQPPVFFTGNVPVIDPVGYRHTRTRTLS